MLPPRRAVRPHHPGPGLARPHPGGRGRPHPARAPRDPRRAARPGRGGGAFVGDGAHRVRGAVAAFQPLNVPAGGAVARRVSGRRERGSDPFTSPRKGAAEGPSARRKVGGYARVRRKEALGDRARGGSRAGRPGHGGRVRGLERCR
ncbi:hypothetical protein SAM23877_1718 [Streptomyces ambofaciens ATCC 23877]|uniref:Uncharacterized protein n=1 Tax=Streptomyces ambofaciens (strain ATCC 23877 / 3486 / DSM 40053 / JCM 4204 / NBRC 12836 / NRRL B-2516) TaxID=278992 RepID=A0A0K2APJ3_STRA7|nr:hypothetical protein SAM23877_1718 [Streptomyces ambofaciens ATCC 23877]